MNKVPSGIDFRCNPWDFPNVTTATVDDKKRVRLACTKPGQVLAVTENADGSITLTPVKADVKEPFPRGSLVKAAEDWNREWAPLARTVKVPPPPKD
jgi:hypothetical protein